MSETEDKVTEDGKDVFDELGEHYDSDGMAFIMRLTHNMGQVNQSALKRVSDWKDEEIEELKAKIEELEDKIDGIYERFNWVLMGGRLPTGEKYE